MSFVAFGRTAWLGVRAVALFGAARIIKRARHRGDAGSLADQRILRGYAIGDHRAAMNDPIDLGAKEHEEHEERWHAWLAKGRARDQATARKLKVLLAFFLFMLVASGMLAYRFAH